MILFICAAAMFLTSIALFFLLNIPSVIGLITGSTAKKAINNIRKQSEKGELTENVNEEFKHISEKKKVQKTISPDDDRQFLTLKLSTDKLIKEAQETMVLNNSSEQTTVLESSSEQTTLLSDNSDVQLRQPMFSNAETTVLNANEPKAEQQNMGVILTLEQELIFTESSEYIE